MNYTALLHLLMGFLSSSIAIYFWYKHKSFHHKLTQQLFIIFTFMTLYTFSLSLPLYIWPNNLQIAGIGFIVGILFSIVYIYYILHAMLFSLSKYLDKSKRLIRNIITVGYSVSAFLLITEFHEPIFSQGFIIWNANPVSAWGLGIFSLITGLLWTFLYFKSAALGELITKIEKVKVLTIGADGALWGLAGVFYFTGTEVIHMITAFALMIGTLTVNAAVFWMAHLQKNGVHIEVEETKTYD